MGERGWVLRKLDKMLFWVLVQRKGKSQGGKALFDFVSQMSCPVTSDVIVTKMH